MKLGLLKLCECYECEDACDLDDHCLSCGRAYCEECRESHLEDCCKRCPGCCDVERVAQIEYEQRDLRTMNADL